MLATFNAGDFDYWQATEMPSLQIVGRAGNFDYWQGGELPRALGIGFTFHAPKSLLGVGW